MHLDPDILYLLLTMAVISALGIPRIRQAVWLPRELKFEDVPPEKLTPAQTDFLSSYDTRLAELGYHPFTTYRVSNMLGHNLIRVYLNSADPAKACVTMVAAKNKTLFSSHVEFATKYADGTRLVINNNNITGIFDDMPGVIITRYRGVTDIAELKRRHDAQAEKLRSRGIVFYTRENYFEDFRQYHVRYCEHQESQKLLRWDGTSGVYRATTWTALRGLRNFLNPIADHFSLPRFALGIMLGGGLPLLAAVERVPIVSWLGAHAGAGSPYAISLLPLAVYTAAGLSVGLLFSRRTFVWGILLGVLPAKFLLGHVDSGYSLWMAAIADLIGRTHNRRKNIL